MEKARELQKNIYFCFDCVDHKKLWKTLKEIGIPDHLLPALRQIFIQVKKQQLEPYMGWRTGSKLGKEYFKAPCLFNLYSVNVMQNAGWMKHKLESRLW